MKMLEEMARFRNGEKKISPEFQQYQAHFIAQDKAYTQETVAGLGELLETPGAQKALIEDVQNTLAALEKILTEPDSRDEFLSALRDLMNNSERDDQRDQ
jgi:hypothetical protein